MSSASLATILPADELFRLQVFAPLVDRPIAVRRGREWVTLKLVEAKASGGRGAGEKFALLFAGGLEQPLQQGTHDFEHPALGVFELFITPVITTSRDSLMYEAVINRETGV
ncbi:MAG: hypothetical protein NTW21_11570 [Verrucomicrobia bacterium]|nr:hypothetical protein [Verrucomicrobiota bacterium]